MESREQRREIRREKMAKKPMRRKMFPTPEIYELKNPAKYVGDPKNVVARSNLEKRFFDKFDVHPGIVKWASEEVAIPYLSPVDNEVHRYFIDLVIQTAKGETYFIEIKPAAQTRKPHKGANEKRYLTEVKTWAVNEAKWKAAKEYAAKRDAKFEILTELDLKTRW